MRSSRLPSLWGFICPIPMISPSASATRKRRQFRLMGFRRAARIIARMVASSAAAAGRSVYVTSGRYATIS